MPKKLIDLRIKKNHAILDNFMVVPDTLSVKKSKALNNIRKLLKWELSNA